MMKQNERWSVTNEKELDLSLTLSRNNTDIIKENIVHRLSYLFPLILFTLTACTEEKAPQQTPAAALPSYSQAAKEYQDKSKAEMTKMDPNDLAVMQQATESLAKTLPDPGLKLGETAPDFTLPDPSGQNISLSSLLKEGPVVLVFYRGAWCPYCNMHLHVLNENLPEFHHYGAQLVAITPQKPDKSAEQLKQDGYPFPVLSDLDSSVMQAYRLYYELDPELVKIYKKLGLNVEDFNGPGRNVLPVPGTFVLDQKGVVRAGHAETDYTQRMEPTEIIKVLEAL